MDRHGRDPDEEARNPHRIVGQAGDAAEVTVVPASPEDRRRLVEAVANLLMADLLPACSGESSADRE